MILRFIVLFGGLIFFSPPTLASVCSQAFQRMAPFEGFEQHHQGQETPEPITIRQTEGRLELTREGITQNFRVSDFGLLCLLRSEASEPSMTITLPNREGECWVYGARISRLVPPAHEELFRSAGFCLSPFSWNPETMWQGTSAVIPSHSP